MKIYSYQSNDYKTVLSFWVYNIQHNFDKKVIKVIMSKLSEAWDYRLFYQFKGVIKAIKTHTKGPPSQNGKKWEKKQVKINKYWIKNIYIMENF